MTTPAWTYTIIVVVVALAAVLPAGYQARGTVFGVSVPPGHADDPLIHTWRSRYRVGVSAVGLVALVGGWAAAMPGHQWLFPVVVLVDLAAVAALFAVANRALRAAKTEQRWYADLRVGAAVDTSLDSDPEPYPWWWLAPAAVVTAATLVVGVVRYPGLPATIPVHFGADGTIDRTAHTTVLTAFTPVIAQVVVTALLCAGAALAVRGTARVDPADPEGSARDLRSYASSQSRTLLFLAAFVDLALVFVALRIWDVLSLSDFATVVFAELSLAIGVFAVIATAAVRPRPRARVATGPGGLVAREEDEHWRLGFVYVNRHDPALLVSRRLGIGWTLNFGNPLSWAALAAVVVIVVAFALAR